LRLEQILSLRCDDYIVEASRPFAFLLLAEHQLLLLPNCFANHFVTMMEGYVFLLLAFWLYQPFPP